MKPIIKIPVDELSKLYVTRGFTARQTADQYRCSVSAVYHHLHRNGISRRSKSEAALRRWGTHEQLKDFSAHPVEKAYLIGFRLGDLSIARTYHGSSVLAVSAGSTRSEQIDLIRLLFQPYAHITVSDYDDGGRLAHGMHCTLNNSFEFLLDKPDHVPAWIDGSDDLFVAFFAGLVDAEGCIYIHKIHGSVCGAFAPGMNIKEVLRVCRVHLIALGVRCGNLVLMRRAGQSNKAGFVTRKDVWRLSIESKAGVLRLFELISPHVKHAVRRQDMDRIQKNINWRNSEEFRNDVLQRRHHKRLRGDVSR